MSFHNSLPWIPLKLRSSIFRDHFWITDTYPDLGQAGVGYFILEPDLETPHP